MLTWGTVQQIRNLHTTQNPSSLSPFFYIVKAATASSFTSPNFPNHQKKQRLLSTIMVQIESKLFFYLTYFLCFFTFKLRTLYFDISEESMDKSLRLYQWISFFYVVAMLWLWKLIDFIWVFKKLDQSWSLEIWSCYVIVLRKTR